MSRALLHVVLWCTLLPGGRQAAAAPAIEAVEHLPAIPRAIDPVRVQAHVIGVLPTVTLRWRVDGAAQFVSTVMGDSDSDAVFEATIPVHPDRTVVEFFVDAADASGMSRWPAGLVGALLQIDGTHDPAATWTPGTRPVYRGILRGADRGALVTSPTGSTFVGTLVMVDGTGEAVRYGCDFRSGSAALPQSFSVSFPGSSNGDASFNLQSRFPHAQVLGAAVYQRAGLPVGEAGAVRFRLNAADLAETGARMFGSYARVESLDGMWVARQFPLNGAGNLYRVDDHGPGTHGELGYETPPTAANYAETYFKITNTAANDYSDLIALTNKLTNAPEATYRTELGTVLNLDQWLGFLAVDALLGNVHEGLQSGRGDGFSLYRGVADTRFVLVPGELDTVFGLGENGTGDARTRSIFGYEGVTGLSRMMNHPDICTMDRRAHSAA